MTRTKLGLLGLCAVVVGMMAMSVSSAQAVVSWLILNKEKTVATNLLAELVGKKDSATLVLHGKVSTFKILLTCTAFALKKVFIAPTDIIEKGGRVVFSGCTKVTNDTETTTYKCTIKSPGAETGTIETNEGKGLVELIGGAVETRIEPEGGTGLEGSFATIRFEGPECVLPESSQVHGVAYFKDCLGQATTHVLEHLVEADATNTKLFIGGVDSEEQLNITKILGSGWIALGGAHAGLLWSAMDA